MEKKDGDKKNMEKLLEGLIEKAKEWEAERDSLYETLDQKLRDKQDAGGEDEDN